MTIVENRVGRVALMAADTREREQVLLIGSKQIRYRLRISARAKRIRLEVNHEKGLLVVVPRRFRLDDLPEILRSKSRWILQKLELFERMSVETSGDSAQGLENGSEILYRGNKLVLTVITTHDGTIEAGLDGGGLRIAMNSGSRVTLEAVLGEWYRLEANRVIRRRVEHLAGTFGVSYSRVFVRSQKTRWGSCSARRNINLNWRLVLMPDDVMDYIVIHELTHLEEMNHSKRFWALVAARCPAYQQHKLWLRRNGPALMQY